MVVQACVITSQYAEVYAKCVGATVGAYDPRLLQPLWGLRLQIAHRRQQQAWIFKLGGLFSQHVG